MRIALDLDGVVCDFTGQWVRMYEQWFDRKVDPKVLTEWHAHQEATHFADEDGFWAWIDATPRFWSSMPPVRGAQGGILQLLYGNHTIELVTNRKEKARQQTVLWLQENWPVHGALPRLNMVQGDKSVLDFQVYVDDAPHRVRQLVKAGKPHVVVFDQPWNQGTLKGATRVKGWAELVEHIGRLASGEVAA